MQPLEAMSAARQSVTGLIGSVAAGRYRLDDIVGQGPHGVTYGATDTHRGAHVAVKVLFEDASDATLSRIRETSRHLHGVDSAFVPLLSTGRLDDGSAFLVREHVEGRSWAAWLDGDGWMHPTVVGARVQAVAPHLDALSAVGAVHGNFTCANVIERADGSCAILDAGLGMASAEARAPEHLDDARALAAVAFELLTGAPPYLRSCPSHRRLAVTMAELADTPFDAGIEKTLARALWAPADEPAHASPGLLAAALSSAIGEAQCVPRAVSRGAERATRVMRWDDPHGRPTVRLGDTQKKTVPVAYPWSAARAAPGAMTTTDLRLVLRGLAAGDRRGAEAESEHPWRWGIPLVLAAIVAACAAIAW